LVTPDKEQTAAGMPKYWTLKLVQYQNKERTVDALAIMQRPVAAPKKKGRPAKPKDAQTEVVEGGPEVVAPE
jgi:hypothetical protein